MVLESTSCYDDRFTLYLGGEFGVNVPQFWKFTNSTIGNEQDGLLYVNYCTYPHSCCQSNRRRKPFPLHVLPGKLVYPRKSHVTRIAAI